MSPPWLGVETHPYVQQCYALPLWAPYFVSKTSGLYTLLYIVEKNRAIDEIPCTEYLPDGTCCPCGKTMVHPWPSGAWECYPMFNDRCCPDYALLTTTIDTSAGTHLVTEFQCCECGASINGDINGTKVCNQIYDPCCEDYLSDGTCCPCGKEQVQWWPEVWKCYPLHNGRCCPDYVWYVHLVNGFRVVDFHCCECGVSVVDTFKVCTPC